MIDDGALLTTQTQRQALCLLTAILLSFLAFGAVLPGEFVVDDKLWAPPASGGEGAILQALNAFVFRPLHAYFLQSLQKLLGIQVAAWHVVSILLHGLNAFLLFLVIGRLLPRLDWRVALVLSWLFLFHPAGSEAVFWISAMAELTVLSLMLLGVWCYLRWRERWTPLRLAGLGALVMLACLFKETAIMLPVVLAAYELALAYQTRRVAWPAVAVAALAAVLFLVLRQVMLGSVSGGQPLALNPGRVAELALTHVRYLWLPDAPPFALRPPEVSLVSPLSLVLAGGLLCAVCAIAWQGKQARPVLAFGLAWGVAGLWPAYAVALVGEGFFNGRQAYIPAAAIPLLAGALLLSLSAPRQRYVLGALALLLGWMLYATASNGLVWRSNEAVYRQAMKVSPSADGPYAAIALEMAGRGEIDAALAMYRQALERTRKPRDRAVYLYNMASLLGQNDRAAESDTLLRELVLIEPNNTHAWTGLGNNAWIGGHLAEAESLYRRALQADPRNQEAASNLARLRMAMGTATGAAGWQAGGGN